MSPTMNSRGKSAGCILGLFLASACGQSRYGASFDLPASHSRISVTLYQSHRPLPVYTRYLVLMGANGDGQVTELPADIGGSSVNLYEVSPTTYMVETQGKHRYMLEIEPARIASIPDKDELSGAGTLRLVGAFEWDEQNMWRFIAADERLGRQVAE
jgi:hypothetical protein